MEEIKEKLHFIKDNWNSYFYKDENFKKYVSPSGEMSTNYFGDIMHYFFDTFEILENKTHLSKESKRMSDYISYSIMILQTMYVHQDLMDEMLNIFNLKESESKDKKEIRYMRNELIGHPISRNTDKDKKIRSTVFLGKEISYSTIHYIKYINGRILNGEEKTFKIADLIEKHKKYLNNEFNKIIEYQIEKLADYKKTLVEKQKYINNLTIDSIREIKSYISKVYEIIPNYSEESLIEALNKYKFNKRYQYYIDNFLEQFTFLITEILESINEKENELKGNTEKLKEIIKIETFIFDDIKCSEGYGSKNISEDEKKKSSLSYYFEKLSQKKQLICIKILKEDYKHNQEISDELEYLRKSASSDIEYDISFVYLKFLLKKYWENKQK